MTLVSKGTSATCTLGCVWNWVEQRFSARTRAGWVTPGRQQRGAISQKPVDSCEPGGSDTHIEPDWSTTSTTFTGKPEGSGGAVHTCPVEGEPVVDVHVGDRLAAR